MSNQAQNNELFVELLMEEIPARMQYAGEKELEKLVLAELAGLGLQPTETETFSTPRRLGLTVAGLPLVTPLQKQEKKGPRLGATGEALAGFLRVNGLDSAEQCQIIDTPKGQFYAVIAETGGADMCGLLPSLLQRVLEKFSWPKSMRWGNGAFAWVRPLHQAMILWNGAALQGCLTLADNVNVPLASSTLGHRFLSNGVVTPTNAKEWQEGLRQQKVMACRCERRKEIATQLAAEAAEKGLQLQEDAALLEEVVGLVEWPVVIAADIDKKFMGLPSEVRRATMRANQKYFNLLAATENVASPPHFLLVADNIAIDGGAQIKAGNERVLRARLHDALFFWEQDKKQSLENRLPALARITYHEKLGNMQQKAERLSIIARDYLADALGADRNQAARAALLCKADLTTGMVGEFPELQGIMGGYYAEISEGLPIARAIENHYQPQGAKDDVPRIALEAVVALADKLDHLCGFFLVGERPTGSKDPYALRRAALGIIRLMVKNSVSLDLGALIDGVLSQHHQAVQPMDRAKTKADLLEFIKTRLVVQLKEDGLRHDVLDSVLAAATKDVNIWKLTEKAQTLQQRLEKPAFQAFMAAWKRGDNILRAEEAKGFTQGLLSDATSFDKELHKALEAAKESLSHYPNDHTDNSLVIFERLTRPLQEFFENVKVNDDNPDIRCSRLSLLVACRNMFNQFADFSKIEG
ncbi:MAG: glycine--tRNA ligase subunit beta [Alphaproteobacteria bacterium]